MIQRNIHLFLILPVVFLIVTGCEKDKITAPFSAKTESSAKLLIYLEEEGDIINKLLIPVLSAEDVYNNLSNYLIIDLRNNSDFVNGHISGAKNVGKDSLYQYIKRNSTNFDKVVLISASGQSAAYYSALLNLTGFSNVYYMNFGMASWNVLFSSVWTNRINLDSPNNKLTGRNNVRIESDIFSYTFYPKGSYSPLPEIKLNSSSQTMEEFVNERVESIIKEGFEEDYDLAQLRSSLTFNQWSHFKERFYTICTGPVVLYSSSPFLTNTYHLVGAVLYLIPPDYSDFRSVTYLQTLPTKDTIAIYSGTGQESAFYTAYLRLLGYNAISMLFGMNNIDYYMLLRAPEIIPYAFQSSYIMNYPYSTGTGK